MSTLRLRRMRFSCHVKSACMWHQITGGLGKTEANSLPRYPFPHLIPSSKHYLGYFDTNY